MPRESIWNRKVEMGTKSEKAEWELENKLPPLFWFFWLFFCVFFILCVWEEKNDSNASSFFFVVMLEQRTQWHQATITFFCV
jgi:hypothetical protein